ncbi:hypothetical protein [Adhaeribacter rhizoryzae]|uniref:Uncharacterized protein n=1 Tax=Adhaeribacter rhizoryzae TaxID=2607907 RepID=A0A5M6D4I4_9BACT|nr:hypothetical protein [Adhaeribacter rhizoryzae]KAA5542427.1 hypothetical protein F0145_18425 [Adhaeribacter rhizoryzae]
MVNKVISYKGAWDIVKEENRLELDEIIEILPEFIEEFHKRIKEGKSISQSEIMSELLLQMDWITNIRGLGVEHNMKLRGVGNLKNGISIMAYHGSINNIHSWIFNTSTFAVKYNYVKVPIMLLPSKNFAQSININRLGVATIERCEEQLLPLTPFSHPYPFLILGFTFPSYSDSFSLDDFRNVVELKTTNLNEKSNEIINKSIEFPEEYHEAGLGILNFFGTYIREQYPNEKAKVKIEQEGKLVRLIVETKDGKSEIIEKALEEYQLIVSRKAQPEEFIKNDILLLKMENQLQLAEVQIKNQDRIIGIQRKDNETLTKLLSDALSSNHNISIVVNSSNSNSIDNNITFTQSISSAFGNISELKELLTDDIEIQKKFQALETALEKIEKETNPEEVKKSPAMSKFKRIVETMTDGNEQLGKAIKALEGGIDIARDLAGKYNNIAQWCGLPQVPTIFTK